MSATKSTEQRALYNPALFTCEATRPAERKRVKKGRLKKITRLDSVAQVATSCINMQKQHKDYCDDDFFLWETSRYIPDTTWKHAPRTGKLWLENMASIGKLSIEESRGRQITEGKLMYTGIRMASDIIRHCSKLMQFAVGISSI